MDELYFSNSELSALVVKATRGAGFPWGIAQEAAMAVASLNAHGLPSVEILLSYIEGKHGRTPTFRNNTLSGKSVCPLLTGTAVCDFGKKLEFPLSFHSARYPLLLVPFFFNAAKIMDASFLMTWKETQIIIDNSIEIKMDGGIDLANRELFILKKQAPKNNFFTPTLQTGKNVPYAIYKKLEKLAMKTMVPISKSSRTGAGAAGDDND